MPFKLRLKKSRQYNVVSKSLFVICVELLDGTNMECTLSSESNGRECLDNVCQRLMLQQPEFFGLRYVAKYGPPHYRWVEMDSPLKRQLDKYARDPNLYLRVMFYVSGINLIHDEMTRYHYFLQLKNDVFEGRISCDIKQAIMLASYSMQAEFGNHDPERHTAEYLKEFALFPKHLADQGHLENLTEAAICQHAALAGVPQGSAEEYYILAAQQLDGYGQETFMAKDETGNKVIIGISLTGIIVGCENTQMSKFYRWKDITNVVNQKRNFGIECQIPEETVQFQFVDPESAKYVWRMCVYQHTFYMQNEQAVEGGQTTNEQVGTLFHSATEENQLSESREELERRDNVTPSVNWGVQSTSCLDLSKPSDLDRLRALLPSYRPAPDYETAMQLKYRAASQPSGNVRPSQVGMLYSSQPEIRQTHHVHENVNSYSHYKHYPDVTQVFLEAHPLLKGRPQSTSQAVLHTYSTPDLDAMQNHVIQGLQLLQLYKPPPPYPINRPSSNSTPDLASQTLASQLPAFINSQVSGSSPDLVSSRGRQFQQYAETGIILPSAEAHRTYTNLAAMYACMPRARATTVPEPIYENVPLPWAAGTEETCGRSRTSSIQSAPEMNSRQPMVRPSNTDRPGPPTENVFSTSEQQQTNPEINSLQNPVVLLPTENNNIYSNMDQQTIAIDQIHPIYSVGEEFPAIQTAHSNLNDPVFSQYSIHQLESSTSNTSERASPCENNEGDGSKQKQRRRWGLLGGKIRTKSSSSLSKEKTPQSCWNTSLPKVPLPSTISKEALCQLLEKKLADSQLFFEFEKIPKKKANADFTTALLPENAIHNRYKDVVPYEENRVRLTPSKDNKTGYINASHITATIGQQQRFYIAAQGPTSNSISCFWQMIWEADVYLIIQLNTLQEEGVVQYCPAPNDRSFETGEYQIWRQFSQETGHCITNKLGVYHKTFHRVRGVWHLQYTEWGDQGCPFNVGHFLGFLEELSSVRQHTVTEIPAGHNRNPPVLVHCGAGVGRTGVVVLSDLLLYTLDHNQELDIPRVVGLLRNQRMLMVQTVAQYRFVYSLLIYYLKHSRLI